MEVLGEKKKRRRSKSLKKRTRYRFISGKRFRLNENGTLEFMDGRRSGRYGEPSTLIRVPDSLLPALMKLLEKYEEIEQCRRNISFSILNTSPEFTISQKLREKVFEEFPVKFED